MPDKSITKVSSEYAPKGRFGQRYLASGIHISMRLWERDLAKIAGAIEALLVAKA